MWAFTGFIGQKYMNTDYAIYHTDLNWLRAKQLPFPSLWSCSSSFFFFPHSLATYVLSLLVFYSVQTLCWCSLKVDREKPLVINILFFFFFFFGNEAFGHVSVFFSNQYCFQMFSCCFFVGCIWIVTWSLALCFPEGSLWLGRNQTQNQAAIFWPQLPQLGFMFGFEILVWPIAQSPATEFISEVRGGIYQWPKTTQAIASCWLRVDSNSS